MTCPFLRALRPAASSHTCCVGVVVLQQVIRQDLDKPDVSKPAGYRQLRAQGNSATVSWLIRQQCHGHCFGRFRRTRADMLGRKLGPAVACLPREGRAADRHTVDPWRLVELTTNGHPFMKHRAHDKKDIAQLSVEGGVPSTPASHSVCTRRMCTRRMCTAHRDAGTKPHT